MGPLDDLLLQRLRSLDRADLAALLEFLDHDTAPAPTPPDVPGEPFRYPVEKG